MTKSSTDSVLVVTARLDGVTIFDQTEVGFDSPTSGLVTLLSVASLVSQTMRENQLQYKDGMENILFLLLNGESFDFSGSARLLYDMKNDQFPHKMNLTEVFSRGTQPQLSLDNIRAVVELGQLSSNEDKNVYIHTENDPSEVVDQLTKNAAKYNVVTKTSTATSLPPSSVGQFLGEKSDLKAVFLSNFDTEFSNKYYHSLYDNPSYHNYDHDNGADQEVVQHLSNVAKMTARTIISVATGSDTDLVSGDNVPGLVNDMLQCFTVTATCDMFKQASSSDEGFPWDTQVPYPFPQYVGVTKSTHATLTKQLLQLLTGDVLKDGDDGDNFSDNKEKCEGRNSDQTVFSYVYLVGPGCYNDTVVTCGHCYQTLVRDTDATSPAFIKEVKKNYDWSSGRYPTWTESVWKGFSGKSFLKGSPDHDYMVFGVGVSVFLISLALVFWSEKHAVVIFSNLSGAEYRIENNVNT